MTIDFLGKTLCITVIICLDQQKFMPGVSFPKYSNPPVVELVCGLLFKPLNKLLAPHLGLIWEEFRAEYPRVRQLMPLAPAIERFTDDPPSREVDWSDLPLFPRVWFERQDETSLIQIQRDRFLYNWKKVNEEAEYPHYDHVKEKLRGLLSKFEPFLTRNELGRIEPLQYELTYVNHIPQGHGWTTLADIGNVFPDFQWQRREQRFLTNLEGVNWHSTFRLPNAAGRLHSRIRHGIRKNDQHPILLLEFTCRGIGEDKSQSGMWDWLDLAHEWIVQAFADLTADDLQKTIWGRDDA